MKDMKDIIKTVDGNIHKAGLFPLYVFQEKDRKK